MSDGSCLSRSAGPRTPEAVRPHPRWSPPWPTEAPSRTARQLRRIGVRRPRHSLAALAGLCLAALMARPAAGTDWLDVRRSGTEGVLRAAVAASGQPARWLRLQASVPAEHALHGWTIEVAAEMIAAKPTPRLRCYVHVRDAARATRAALVVDGAAVWVRHGGGTQREVAAAFSIVEGVRVPLAVLAALALAPRYDAQVEGEFNGSAIMRLRPSYTHGAGLQPLKLGVSKQSLQVTVAEVDDAKGQSIARALWLDGRGDGPTLVPTRLRLRGGHDQDAVDWLLVDHRLGKRAWTRWNGNALRGP